MLSRKQTFGSIIAIMSIAVITIAAFFIYQKYFTLPSTPPDEIDIWYDHTNSDGRRERYHFGLDNSTVVVMENGKTIFPFDQNIDVSLEQLQGLYTDLGPYFVPSSEARSRFPHLADPGLAEMTAVKIRWVNDGQTFEGVTIESDSDDVAIEIRRVVNSFTEARISEQDSGR